MHLVDERGLACALLGLLLVLMANACAAPLVYPRSAELAEAGKFRLRGGTTAGLVFKQADVVIDGRQLEAYDVVAARDRSNGFPAVDWLGAVISHELAVDASMGWCEAGSLLSFVRVGAELRCAVLDEDLGAPFSVAASVAALYQFSIAGLEGDPNPWGSWRAGIDTSVRMTGMTPLLGIYVDHGQQRRELLDDDVLGGSHGDFVYNRHTVVVIRDEWRLASPIGVSWPVRPKLAVTLGLVPELTLYASPAAESSGLYSSDSPDDALIDFDQRWAIFAAVTVHALL